MQQENSRPSDIWSIISWTRRQKSPIVAIRFHCFAANRLWLGSAYRRILRGVYWESCGESKFLIFPSVDFAELIEGKLRSVFVMCAGRDFGNRRACEAGEAPKSFRNSIPTQITRILRDNFAVPSQCLEPVEQKEHATLAAFRVCQEAGHSGERTHLDSDSFDSIIIALRLVR